MAYRYEQTPVGTDLVIDGWDKGIGDSPYLGLTDISYGNTSNVPGEVTVNFPLTTTTVTGGTMDKPLHKAVEIDAGAGGTVSEYYILDAKANVFYSTDGTTWTFGSNPPSSAIYVEGNSGMVWWKGYLLVFYSTKVYWSSNGGASFTDWTAAASLTALQSGSTHYAIAAQDDAIYFCNGSFVGSILQNAGSTFDPNTASTYTFNASALSLPTYDMAASLAELNNLLLVGGALNKIYPWDRISPTFGQPLFTAERFIYRMVTMNTNTFIFTGHPVIPTGRGNIYITNGSQIDLFKKIPDSFVTVGGTATDLQEPYWRFGDAMFHRNKLWFGAAAFGNKSGTVITDTGGAWYIDINTKALSRANLLSGGNTVIPSVMFPNDIGTTIAGLGYLTGGSASNGIGSGGFMNRSTNTMNTAARAISDKITVGLKNTPKAFKNLEAKLYTALVTGETIAFVAITDQGSTTVGTMSTTDGLSVIFDANFNGTSPQGIQWLQIQATMTPTNTNPTYIRLREVRLR